MNTTSLLKQKQILSMRERLLADISNPNDRERIDASAFAQLREASPEGLVPIVIQRNNSDFLAAYLVQEVGDSGKRILVKGERWTILRARKSAISFNVPGPQSQSFEKLVELQRLYFTELEKMKLLCFKRKKK